MLLAVIFILSTWFSIFNRLFVRTILFDSRNNMSYVFPFYSQETAPERLHVNSQEQDPTLLLPIKEPENLRHEKNPTTTNPER